MPPFFPLLVMALAGCAPPPSKADLTAVRQVSMSGPSLDLAGVAHPSSAGTAACAVSTLVTEEGEVVGYCRGGRQCRTSDRRPVEPGRNNAPEYRAAPASSPAIDLARRR